MKKTIILLAIIIVPIIFSFKNFSFSETEGYVHDENGKPIDKANVSILYHCTENKVVDSDSHSFKKDIVKTNADGKFAFDHFNVGFKNRILYGSCEKKFRVFKEGYCTDKDLCLGQILWANDTQLYGNFEMYFSSEKTLQPDEKYVSFVLNSFNEWSDRETILKNLKYCDIYKMDIQIKNYNLVNHQINTKAECEKLKTTLRDEQLKAMERWYNREK